MIPFCDGLNIRIYVPYTDLSAATQVALLGYQYEKVDVSADDFAYYRHFAQRWAQRQTWVNVEHDCVPWPGALEELMRCPEPWCTFEYSLPCLRERPMHHPTSTVPLGCTKFGADLMAGTLDMWEEPLVWWVVDGRVTTAARAAGFEVHQHHPGIVNAAPWLVAMSPIEPPPTESRA